MTKYTLATAFVAALLTSTPVLADSAIHYPIVVTTRPLAYEPRQDWWRVPPGKPTAQPTWLDRFEQGSDLQADKDVDHRPLVIGFGAAIIF